METSGGGKSFLLYHTLLKEAKRYGANERVMWEEGGDALSYFEYLHVCLLCCILVIVSITC